MQNSAMVSMQSPLRQRIVSLANRFVDEILAEITSSIADHFGRRAIPLPPIATRGGGRRTADELEEMQGRILELVGKNESGLRAEKLRAELGVSRAALARPLARLLSDGRLRKTGEKRRTTYYPGKNGHAAGAAETASRGAKPKSKRKKKAPATAAEKRTAGAAEKRAAAAAEKAGGEG